MKKSHLLLRMGLFYSNKEEHFLFNPIIQDYQVSIQFF